MGAASARLDELSLQALWYDVFRGPPVSLALVPDIALLVGSSLQLAWAFKLRRLQLVEAYRVLFVYLLTTAVMSAAGIFLYRLFLGSPSPATANLYGWYWVVYQPLSWTLFFCLVVELFRHSLAGFTGLQRLGQWVIYVASAAAGAAFLGMIFLDISVETWKQFWRSGTGSVYFSLTLICFLLVSFATFFRLAVPGNVKVTFAAFGLAFIVEASLFLIPAFWEGIELGEQRLITSLVHVVCVAFGTFAFTKTGEKTASKGAPVVRDAGGGELSAKLRSFSKDLSKILRS